MANGDPWGATVDGVAALLPAAAIPDELAAGQKAVTRAHVQAWVDQLAARVALRLAGWDTLKDAGRRDHVRAAAADLVHHGAAAYVEAARFPERAGKTDESYSAVLWARYVDGLAELAALLEGWLSDPGEATGGDAGNGRPAWSAPATSFPDDLRF